MSDKEGEKPAASETKKSGGKGKKGGKGAKSATDKPPAEKPQAEKKGKGKKKKWANHFSLVKTYTDFIQAAIAYYYIFAASFVTISFCHS